MMNLEERNQVAEWMMAKGYATGHGDSVEDLLTELEWQIRERQRNQLADKIDQMPFGDTSASFALWVRGQQ